MNNLKSVQIFDLHAFLSLKFIWFFVILQVYYTIKICVDIYYFLNYTTHERGNYCIEDSKKTLSLTLNSRRE